MSAWGLVGLAIDVPGLDRIVPEIADGRVVVVESAADPAKSFFLRHLLLTTLRSGGRGTFVTSRDRSELLELLATEGGKRPDQGNLQIFEEDSLASLDEYGQFGGVLAVDSFSLLTLGLTAESVALLLRRLRSSCRDKRTTVLLGTDRGMLDARTGAVTTHLADGVLEFHSKEGADGVIRFLRIPKWMDRTFVDQNIYYTFDGKRIAIDLRRRIQ